MAFQQIPGSGMYLPQPIGRFVAPAMTISVLAIIDATGEKIAYLGNVRTPDRGTKSIRTIGFLPGSVVSAGGSVVRISLQDWSLTAGPPLQPDEVQDQFIDVALNTVTTNTWFQTGNLSVDRSVVNGEQLAIVWEYDAGGRLGADALTIRGLTYGDATNPGEPATSLKTGGSWGVIQTLPCVILGFSDGTFGTLDATFPFSATGTIAFKQDTAVADEYALEFSLPCPVKVDGLWALLTLAAATSDFSFVLYSGTTAMTGGTIAVDGNTMGRTAANPVYIYRPFSQEIELSANTTYRLAVKPTQTTSTVTISYIDVNAAGHFQAHDGGANLVLNSRLDLGAWIGPVATRRPMLGLRISSISDGGG